MTGGESMNVSAMTRVGIAALACAACATQSATPVETAAAPLAIVEEQDTLKTPTGEIYGTLELPAARTPVAVALIIAGSGPTDRNGNTPALPGSNNSLKMLADGLAERGIASVRYDKRGIAASRAAMTSESDLRFNHFIEDSEAWIKQLRADKRFSTITVIGHSEGSLIGMVAAGDAGADAFVSLEGAGRKAQDILAEQLKQQLPPELFAQTERALAELSAGRIPTSTPPMLAALFRPSVLPYLVSWFKYDPGVEIGKLSIPVLIVQGTTDIQTSLADAKALTDGNPSAKFLEIEGMNHILKEVSGDRMAQIPKYSDPSLPVVPKLLDEIAAFIKPVAKKS
jgi:pimeloyl-ACP methyl ester carboxylesterase